MGGLNGEAPLGMWALRKEARRHMYETSTDQVRVHRRGLGSSSSSSVAAMCQKCLRRGHWTYECKNGAVYVQRPSRSQQLRNPKLRQPFNKEMPPELLIQEEVKLKAEKSKKLKLHIAKSKKKETSSGSRSLLRRKRRSSVSSGSSSSDSSSSDSSDSDSDSLGSDRVSSTSSSENDRSSRSFKRKRRD
ncbi:uncharacterized protein PITG_19536 [Phytophthora infestans T30-4]|uniref:Uncharacterized protein n=2 Tax=Phytophthora infestans TaxID=4787 RepID=D0P073_PHYIT|nr:uncharacterized protein PITG_19536 [Phytophthora infestans T30-4]EEY70243.1 conserved hypothetical protein [Phytophthora infestans T30-4]KAF4035828.1 Zinc knuckle [Phytophthora infestans]KAF4140904.1 Zinc knuckle [Phytophthora infestans]KAI9986067.1 hypothetical protein PInf_024914 [Phytophthora infestans]|eukprot:XP_002997002.1 conserved hypothetical protein [Phytophthora infestans T30-4]